ncbi:SpoIID/LytB domain-containing protein [Anaeromyxobacter dehalogenans]|uniref:Sporulation protein n=1 Tax=Anaeromyxobacter dehalogenans (strain 2CP-C) TaxID=290397 RepID=Q2IJH7_ANADE|nr:SpoIID/LytB domain-containing protein [Anaeromyxobacter dehalogenans]ABC81805.1 Sporulation protein [Anaeromyxobacter dehalogenans 2CP-C]
MSAPGILAALLLLTAAPTAASSARSVAAPAAPSVAATAAPPVDVELLARLAPRRLELEAGGRRRSVVARGDALVVDGVAAGAALALPARTWRVVAGHRDGLATRARTYRAALRIRAERGVLRVRATMALEDYVAGVVASEALPGTPREALRALAVVVRSYALAAPPRHADGARCDLAHCQLLRGGGADRAHEAAARAAARATAGEALRLPGGAVAAAPFHAACGGHTADPREAFGGAGIGAAAVADPGCAPERWRAALDPAALAAAVRAALAASDPGGAAAVPARLRAADLAVRAGAGGWVAQVAGADGGWALGGDAFARAADASAGRGVVRSSRFRLASASGAGRPVLEGAGRGHGVGLCQAGAARRARAGQGYREILRAYFPGAAVATARAPDGPSIERSADAGARRALPPGGARR